MKVIIVGGVAGGASCAARLRRSNEAKDVSGDAFPCAQLPVQYGQQIVHE
jgi:NADPH-dependent 2,4-dienoyl-CoA reductase/sulfur reductase-like enzyme